MVALFRQDRGEIEGYLKPGRAAFAELLVSVTCYPLVIAAFAVLTAKGYALSRLDDSAGSMLRLLPAAAADWTMLAALAAMFSVAEGRKALLLLATVPLAILVAAISLINAAYLGMTSEQLTWEAMSLGFARFSDMGNILIEHLGQLGPLVIVLVIAALAGPPLVVLILGKGKRMMPEERHHKRAHAAVLVAAMAALIWIMVPRSDSLAIRMLSHNATVQTYFGWLDSATEDPQEQPPGMFFAGYQPEQLVDSDSLKQLAARHDAPNLLVIFLESTRYQITSLPGASGRAKTPALNALAKRGRSVRNARAVVPHTTKSVFSMLCGRYPFLQLPILEPSAAVSLQCLPAALRQAGYRTAFMQSALGKFEDRPRLVEKLGFETFKAWEDIGGETLGYLASDDESLREPFFAWLDEQDAQKDQRFFAALLGSAAHHPYRLSSKSAALAKQEGLPTESDLDRYARIVEAEDRLLAALVQGLEERGILDNTIIVAVGDHGEGFGEKGIRQHDNNFYDEALVVPWVMAGPGITMAPASEGNFSLLDMTPTLMSLLNLAPVQGLSLPGQSALLPAEPQRRHYFSCWYDNRCRGYVEGKIKLVFVPEHRQAWHFDLAQDPNEQKAQPLSRQLMDTLGDLHKNIDSHRTMELPLLRMPLVEDYGEWNCAESQPCVHPKSPKGHFFEDPP